MIYLILNISGHCLTWSKQFNTTHLYVCACPQQLLSDVNIITALKELHAFWTDQSVSIVIMQCTCCCCSSDDMWNDEWTAPNSYQLLHGRSILPSGLEITPSSPSACCLILSQSIAIIWHPAAIVIKLDGTMYYVLIWFLIITLSV